MPKYSKYKIEMLLNRHNGKQRMVAKELGITEQAFSIWLKNNNWQIIGAFCLIPRDAKTPKEFGERA